jgi:hypothetical protein
VWVARKFQATAFLQPCWRLRCKPGETSPKFAGKALGAKHDCPAATPGLEFWRFACAMALPKAQVVTAFGWQCCRMTLASETGSLVSLGHLSHPSQSADGPEFDRSLLCMLRMFAPLVIYGGIQRATDSFCATRAWCGTFFMRVPGRPMSLRACAGTPARAPALLAGYHP